MNMRDGREERDWREKRDEQEARGNGIGRNGGWGMKMWNGHEVNVELGMWNGLKKLGMWN